jgi:hypothetical protein
VDRLAAAFRPEGAHRSGTGAFRPYFQGKLADELVPRIIWSRLEVAKMLQMLKISLS